MSYAIGSHHCKLCRTCSVCHKCLQSKASIFRAKSSDSEEIQDLCENSAHTHYKDAHPQYIIVGPNNEIIETTQNGTTLSVKKRKLNEIPDEFIVNDNRFNQISDESIADDEESSNESNHFDLDLNPSDYRIPLSLWTTPLPGESSVDESDPDDDLIADDVPIADDVLIDDDVPIDDDVLIDDDEPVSLDCNICNKTFSNKRDLEIHLIYHSTEEIHRCKVCGLMFEYSYELIKHSLNHRNPNNVCEFCKREFKSLEKLRVHKTKHTGEFPYSCVVCDKGFKDLARLKSHLLCHTEDKPFVCDKCGKGFRRKSQLRTHSWVHSEVKPFSCEFCEKPFNYKCNLRLHIQRTHKVYENIDIEKVS